MLEKFVELEFLNEEFPERDKALSLARKFSAEEGSTISLRAGFDELRGKIDQLSTLWRIVGQRGGSRILLKGKEVPYREFFKYSTIIQCNIEQDLKLDSDGMECYEDHSQRGWGCLHLRAVGRYIPHFQRRDLITCWYDYGSFNEDRTWNVHLDSVFSELKNEAEKKNLFICRRFSLDTLQNRVFELPRKLDPVNDEHWEIVKERSGDSYRDKKVRPAYGQLNETDAPLIPIAESSLAALMKGDQTRITHIEKEQIKHDQNDKHAQKKERKIPETRFADIGGIDSILTQVREVIELPLARPNLLKHFGIKPHRGILLYGPPGCGKTMIARAIAAEVRAHFIVVNGPEMLSKWHGQSEENLRNTFEEARELSPAIIFFDEIDSIARTRSGDDAGGYESKMVNQLLTMMDGVEEYEQVAVIAATNRRDVLDPAVLRPGRFDYNLEVPLPGPDGVRQILEINLRKLPLGKNVDHEEISSHLNGLSGADISFVVREAAYNSMRRNVDMIEALRKEDSESYDYVVELPDFHRAINKVRGDGYIEESTGKPLEQNDPEGTSNPAETVK